MPHRYSGRAAGGLLTAAAATAGVVASLAAGYTAARAVLSDGSAYAAKGNALAHVNGVSRSVDAVTRPLGKQRDLFDVVTLPDGNAAVVDRRTNTMTTIDGATMSPTATVSGHPGSTPVAVVASGDGGWLLDQDGATVRRLVDGKPQATVRVPGGPVDGAPGPDGSLYVITGEGHVVSVDVAGTTHQVDAPDAHGAGLTQAGGHAYLVTTSGAVVALDGTSAETVASVPLAAPGLSGQMVVGALGDSGGHVLIVFSDALAIVDPESGSVALARLHADTAQLGRPVEFRGKAYVPDFEHHKVLVVDLATRTLGKPLDVPRGSDTFSLFVSGGRLWANDQYAQHMLEVDSSGPHRVDKGSGNGVHDVGPTQAKKPGAVSPPPTTGVPPTSTGGSVPVSVPGGSTVGGTTSGSSGTTQGGDGGGGGDHTVVKKVTVPTFPPHTKYQDACTQLEAVALRCHPISAGPGADGATDDVLETVPAGGGQAPEDSEVIVTYVGPAVVPDFRPGTTPVEECAYLQQAALGCRPQPASSPAPSPNDFGTVADTNPSAGSEVAKGQVVTVSYYDSFVMPDYVGAHALGTDTCQALNALTLSLPGKPDVHPSCSTAASTDPNQHVAKDGSNANVVIGQNVAAGSAYRPGPQPVTLTIYNTNATLPDYPTQTDASGLTITGQAATDDCNQVFNCGLTDGDVPVINGALHPELVGRVEKVTDAAGQPYQLPATLPVGTATNVVIVQWRGADTVPDVTGQSTAGGAGSQACQTLLAAGFGCDVTSNHPFVPVLTPNLADPQGIPTQPAAGQQAQVGTVVVVPNTPWAVQPLTAFQATSGDSVWAVRLGTTPPSNGNYNGPTHSLGYAYPPNSGIPTGAWQPAGLFCTSGAANCDGHSPNHMYTRADLKTTVWSLDGTAWRLGGVVADLVPPTGAGSCAGGLKPVYRTWIFSGSKNQNHTYFALLDPDLSPYNGQPGGGHELVGCVWPTAS